MWTQRNGTRHHHSSHVVGQLLLLLLLFTIVVVVMFIYFKIEEGSTSVRVGSSIFGERVYHH